MANIKKGTYFSYLKLLKHAFEILAESGNVYKDFGNLLYDMLNTIGLMKLPKEEKLKIMDQVKLEVMAEAAKCTNEAKRSYLLSIVDDAANPTPHADLIKLIKQRIFTDKMQSIMLDGKDSVSDFLDCVEDKINDHFNN